MKKIISLLVLFTVLLTVSVSAGRSEDRSEPIENFRVLKWISPYAPNEVAVLTVNGGERGYVVISATTEEKYLAGLEIAKSLLGTEPTQLGGTRFAYVRAEI